MRPEEFAGWLPVAQERYAQDLARSFGVDIETARAQATRDAQRFFPDDLLAAGHAVSVIEADGERVGELWLGDGDGEFQRSLFVYDIHVDERHRGRGIGRRAMLLAEDEARRRGHDRISLNTMGDNEMARHLYRSLGYTETFVSMEKTLPPEPA